VAAQEQALGLDGDVPPGGTRQIVAFANGDHREATCRALWEWVPEAYRKCRGFSDFWKTYAAVLPEKTYRSVGKETGKAARFQSSPELDCSAGASTPRSPARSVRSCWHP
jgi:hypothetical protein